MRNRVFVDTNVLIYSFFPDFPDKRNIARNLLLNELSDIDILISSQVLNEFIGTLYKYKLPSYEINSYLTELLNSLELKQIELNTILKAIDFKDKYHYSWWDSLILASAVESNCSIIYSEDLHHGQMIEKSLEIINPFVGTQG